MGQERDAKERQRIGQRNGGFRRAINLSDARLKEIGRKGAQARWGGLTAEERKIERARGRAPKAAPESGAQESEEKSMAAGA